MAADTSKFSFWEQISDSRLFCASECKERCRAELEDNEAYDDFHPVRINFEDEAIASLPHACHSQHELKETLLPRNQFSLPWADLNGTQKDSLLTPERCPRSLQGNDSVEHVSPLHGSQRRGRNDSTSPPRRVPNAEPKPVASLLPFSKDSKGSSFSSLPKPRFLSGIPTKAYLYRPNPRDPIDVELHRILQGLDAEASQVLALRCVSPGRYEIDGRQVHIYWDEFSGSSRLLVHEDEVGGPSIADMPLPAYMRLVVNVALDLQRPVNAGSLTFLHVAGSKTSDLKHADGEDRYRAMRIACTQAKLREEEAERQAVASARAASMQASVQGGRQVS